MNQISFSNVFSCFLPPHRTSMASLVDPTIINHQYHWFLSYSQLEFEPMVSTSSSVMIHRFREGKHCPPFFHFCLCLEKVSHPLKFLIRFDLNCYVSIKALVVVWGSKIFQTTRATHPTTEVVLQYSYHVLSQWRRSNGHFVI